MTFENPSAGISALPALTSICDPFAILSYMCSFWLSHITPLSLGSFTKGRDSDLLTTQDVITKSQDPDWSPVKPGTWHAVPSCI